MEFFLLLPEHLIIGGHCVAGCETPQAFDYFQGLFLWGVRKCSDPKSDRIDKGSKALPVYGEGRKKFFHNLYNIIDVFKRTV
jgi:hypothetical protein